MDKLAQLRAYSCEELPTPQVAILTRTTARLRRSGIDKKALQSGETVPDFEFIDNDDKRGSLYELLDRGPVVLNFFRGLWCMFCKTEFEAYTNIQDDLFRLGCTYLALSPQQPLKSEPPADGYQSIYDRNNEIARKFGIVYRLQDEEIELFKGWGLKLDEVNNTTRWELPLPATYVIAPDRTIAYHFIDVDFRARCCPDELIDEIKRISEST